MKLWIENKRKERWALGTKKVRMGRRQRCVPGPPAWLRRDVLTLYCPLACSCYLNLHLGLLSMTALFASLPPLFSTIRAHLFSWMKSWGFVANRILSDQLHYPWLFSFLEYFHRMTFYCVFVQQFFLDESLYWKCQTGWVGTMDCGWSTSLWKVGSQDTETGKDSRQWQMQVPEEPGLLASQGFARHCSPELSYETSQTTTSFLRWRPCDMKEDWIWGVLWTFC